MANARLQETQHSTSFPDSNASEPLHNSMPHTLSLEIPSLSVSVAPKEHLSDAPSEREALESALKSRKSTLEAQLEAVTLGKLMHKELLPHCDATGRHVARYHRDFLLQEMEWMAADFNQERKWRVRNAKTLSHALVSHLNRQEGRLARQVKSLEMAKRRRAARLGREVKKFWAKIDKIIAFKVKLQADELKQQHMETQLLQLVHQTENYAMALAASFQEEEESTNRQEEEDGEFELDEEEGDDEASIEEEEKKNGVMSKRQVALEVKMLQEEGDMSLDELKTKYADMRKECKDEGMDVDSAASSEDGDFQADEEEEDDERSIAEEERKSGVMSRRQAAREVATLQEEGEMSIDELRARYAGVLAVNDETLVVEGGDAKMMEEENDDEDVGDGEFVPTKCKEEDEADDETTIEEEKRLGRDASLVSRAEELRLLKEESNMSIEQLRARYATVSDDEESSSDRNGSARSDVEHDSIETYRKQECPNDGNTKELVDVSTSWSPVARKSGYKRPFLLTSRLNLREYQETGVNWLVSMCERRINGILADEMGLGKTIQTISLLAHLACAQGLWGPHLIVVPTSCLVNWEMEFKRWCPAFKVLTYFGSAKRRKELRQGWSKQNAFQVCITSYQLVVQDAHCFKRKKWYYLILDEAHNIKNWKSLRWQTLLTFSSQRRLLLTGTPLQNNLLELWALMHFLMPHVFASRKEFSYWFQNPLALMVENGSDPAQSGDNGVEGGKDLVAQLHGIIRPFVLRRLKKDVAKQLPGKFEHVITCQLSRRQRFLYEDFISRSATRRAMFGRGKGRGANFMSMMNVLMQLRKVCNHPDLFEPRPVASPLDMPGIHVRVPSRCGYLVDEIVNERPRVAFWADSNLPGLELLLSEKFTSKRRRELFFYDVSAPLPDDTVATVPSAYESKKDIVRRIIRLAAKRRKYWENKRSSVAQLQKLRVGLYLGEPVFGSALIRACTMPTFISPAMEVHMHRAKPFLDSRQPTLALQDMVRDPEERLASLQTIVNKSVCYVPKARAMPARVIYGGGGFVYDDNFVLSRKAQAEELSLKYAQPVAHRIVAPYYNSFKRTQLFFPDKALVQFDCGKLQQLAVLLRTLKRGGHRCLIFTQMSSMLNILEVFLNLHGHTYFRLDGATKVEKRQMLMERFNRDDKIFCFILSTRSGGLGINLTGADAVIFYDSDWNPAMDAQAQDRAHRIGQTRDVHIYRLVSEHTVEENILRKAQQKRHLDFLVMSEGQFTTDFFSKASLRELMVGSSGKQFEDIESEREVDDESTDEDMEDDNDLSLDTVERAMAQLEDEEDVVAMKGARAEYLQEQHEFDEDVGGDGSVASPSAKVSTSRVGDTVSSRPSTPSSVSISTVASERGDDEDEEFGNENTANEGTTEEVNNQLFKTEDMCDFDGLEPGESIGFDEKTDKARRKRQRCNTSDQRKMKKRLKLSKLPNENGKHGEKVRERARDAAEEQKLQAWKASVQSLQGFEDSLNAVDRYALHFREDVDPLYTYTPAQQAAALAKIDPNPPASTLLEDIEQTEIEKREEEARLIAEGELIVGQMDDNDESCPEKRREHYTELYRRERARVLFEQRKRLLTGEAWSLMRCAKTGQPFYFNADTREATWECPPVRVANEQLKSARGRGYEGLPPPALLRVLSMLGPFPERHRAQMVCRSWHTAAQHHSLFVKISASDFDPGSPESLAKMLAKVAPGGTVLFGPGVYQLNETLEISKSLRLLAAPDTHVELQMHSCHAQLRWSARGGVIRGFYFTRSNSASESAVVDVKPSSDATELVPAVKESKRALRNHDKRLGNWQNLLRVVGDGQLRVEYCEFDGNGLGNACICVWGRGEKKKKKKKRKRETADIKAMSMLNPTTPLVATSVSLTPTTTTIRVTTTPVSTPAGTTAFASKPTASSVAPSSMSDTRKSVVLTTVAPVTTVACGTTPVTTTACVTATKVTTSQVTTQVTAMANARPSITTQTAADAGLLPIRPVVSASVTTTPPVYTPGSQVTTTPRNVAAPSATITTPAADTLLVLQNCRIRGAGSSGVLLMRGSLVMSLNTVEGNAHSGVTILGGQALLRRNKVQRNARFGLRLLYHAGNVIVEDNAVFGNACGNLDVDNSGRRFVVRLNDMDKGKKASEKLPHLHGKLRLKTYRVLEKEVPRAPVPFVKPATSTTTEYWKRQLAMGAAASTASPAMPMASSVVTSTASSIMRPGIPMGFMRPVVFPQGSNPLHVSHLPMAFASLGAKPTIPSMTLNRPATSAQLPTTTVNLQRTVSALGTASSVPARPGILSVTTTAPTTVRATSSIEPQKQRQKRRPKTQQLIAGGREILLRDTCEKPTEKVVKPRRSKDQLTPVVGSTGLQRITSPSPLQLKFAPGSTAAAVAAAMSAMMANTAKLQAAAFQMQTGVRFGNTSTTKTPVAMASTVGVKAVTPTTVPRPAQTKSIASMAAKNVTAIPSTPMVSPVQKSNTPMAATKPPVAVKLSVGTKIATSVAELPALKVMAPQSIDLVKQSAKPGEEGKLETARMEAKSTGQEGGKKSFGEANGQPGNKASKP
ncbi:hypothetical protein KXD40_009169 [Peronospora effusa]|nr:hypothetical protein KXD40_009169 [Peronospora effusa]